MRLTKLGCLLAVRARYEGGVGENQKHEVNKTRCFSFSAVRARNEKP